MSNDKTMGVWEIHYWRDDQATDYEDAIATGAVRKVKATCSYQTIFKTVTPLIAQATDMMEANALIRFAIWRHETGARLAFWGMSEVGGK